jgi:hypothetical protein
MKVFLGSIVAVVVGLRHWLIALRANTEKPLSKWEKVKMCRGGTDDQ